MPVNRTPPSSTSSSRERHGESSGRALVSAWEASGLPQAVFARRRGVSPQRLSYWRLRLGHRGRLGAGASATAFAEIPPAAAAAAIGCAIVMVELGAGVRIHVKDTGQAQKEWLCSEVSG